MKDKVNLKLHIWGKITSFDTSCKYISTLAKAIVIFIHLHYLGTSVLYAYSCIKGYFSLNIYYCVWWSITHIINFLKRDMWRQMHPSIIGYLNQTEKGLVCPAMFSPVFLCSPITVNFLLLKQHWLRKELKLLIFKVNLQTSAYIQIIIRPGVKNI